LANPLNIAISKIRAGFVISAKSKLFRSAKAEIKFFRFSREEMKMVKLRVFFPSSVFFNGQIERNGVNHFRPSMRDSPGDRFIGCLREDAAHPRPLTAGPIPQ
jgi:hypothetical protein